MASNSSNEPRSPLYGTATYSTLSATQTPMSPSRLSYSRSNTPIPSSDGDDSSYGRPMRRSYRGSDTDSYSYSDDNSIEDSAEVEAALYDIDNEIDDTEDAVTEWSSRGTSYITPSTYTTTSTGLGVYSSAFTATDRLRLSTITERTENASSRPTSHNFSVQSRQGSGTPNPHRRSTYLGAPASPIVHSRSATDPPVAPPPGRRAGDLIAFFEEKKSEPALYGHTRTTSAPSGPRSPSPFLAPSTSTPYMGTTTLGSTTGYGYGSTTGYESTSYGYGSRPSSPTKSRSGSSVSSSASGPVYSSLLSPPLRSSTSMSGDSRFVGSSSLTGSYTTPSTFTNTATNTLTNTFTSTSQAPTNTFTGTQTTLSTLRRPQTSPRSPLTSVRNIVAAWKERAPRGARSAAGSVASAEAASPPGRGDGLFSIKRRAERGAARLRSSATAAQRTSDPPPYLGAGEGSIAPSTPRQSSLGLLPPPLDVAELGAYAKGNAEPSRIGLLWYLNVHAAPPYRWQRCQALLYPHMLLLSWIAPGGGRGIVTLDLLNCTEVRSVPSPTHISAREDVGTIAARSQSVEDDSPPLMELLCPFQLLYSDGVERLAAESARERVRWVSAIWEVLDRSVTLPDRSASGSPTGSIRTIRSESQSDAGSASGSASTVFVPPLHTIPDLSDLDSLSGSSVWSGLSRRPSLASAHHTRATDDAGISNQAYLYPGDPRVIAPSRSSSLRRTSSMTDLDAEFASAVRRARDARPGLGFGLGLAGGVPLGEGSPVTVSSGPRLGKDVWVTPPPSVGRGSGTSSKARSDLSVTDEAFFSANSGGSGTRVNGSSAYSLTSDQDTRTGTGLRADGTYVDFTSGSSGTQIIASTLSLRGSQSASYLGDSHDGSSYTYSSSSPSRRFRARSSSRSYTTSYPSGSEEYSDTFTRTYTGYDYTSDSGLTRSYPSASYPSTSYPPTPSAYSAEELPEEHSDYVSASSGSPSEYATAKTPSVASSYKSLPTIPSDSGYDTAEVCLTEYVTAEKCATEVSTDYTTAEICSTEPETEYWTAEPKDLVTERSTPHIHELVLESEESTEGSIISPPSEVPTIPSSESSLTPSELYTEELDPRDIPLPPSIYSPSISSEPLDLSTTESESPPSISMIEHDESLTESISGPSIGLSISTPVTPTQGTPSTPTVTNSTIDTSNDLTPTRSSSSIPPASPSIHGSYWAAETDGSYDTSWLGPSPSMRSLALNEGLDVSYDTSILRPSASSISSLDRLTPVTEMLSASISSTPSSPMLTQVPMITRSPAILPSLVLTSTLLSSTELTESSSLSSSSVSSPSTVATPSGIPSSTPSPPSAPTPSTVTTELPVLSSPDVLSPPSALPQVTAPTPSLSLSLESSESSLSTDIPSSPSSPSVLSLGTSVLGPRSLSNVPRLDIRSPSTVPSLLSSAPSPLPRRPLSPGDIPLPRSPSISMLSISGSAPSVSMSVSVSTPQSNVPSVHSELETVSSEDQGPNVAQEINRILEQIRAIDDHRGSENRELAENVRAIRDELYDLSDYLHQRETPPPVPHRDTPVGGSSVMLSDRSVSELSEHLIPMALPTLTDQLTAERPSGPRGMPIQLALVPIPLTPPPFRPASPSVVTIGDESFLESHHSDDYLWTQSEIGLSEVYRSPASPPASPPYFSSSSSSSSTPSPSSSSSDLPETQISSSTTTSGPYLSRTSSEPTPPPASPSPSSISSVTARPQPREAIREILERVRETTNALWEGQTSTNHMLDEIRASRPTLPDNSELQGRLQRIEDLLERVLQYSQTRPQPIPEPSGRQHRESSYESDSSAISALERELLGRDDRPIIHMPAPVRTGPSLDDQLAELLSAGPQIPPSGVQPPPPLIPFSYQPAPRASRPRSLSPTFEGRLPPRPATVPIREPVVFDRPRRPIPRIPGRGRYGATMAPGPSESRVSSFTPIIPTAPSFPAEQRQARIGGDGFVDTTTRPGPAMPSSLQDPGRAGTAPPDLGGADPRVSSSWYRRRQPGETDHTMADTGIPPPGSFGPSGQAGGAAGAPPTFVPMPPGPTVVQVPLFDTLMDILRENRLAQLATVDQQRELMRYMRGLNEWLERDVHDRQSELRGVSARVDELRSDLSRLGVGVQPSAPPPAPTDQQGPVIPPVPAIFSGPGMPQVQPQAQRVYPPGFQPGVGVGMPQPFVVTPVVPAGERDGTPEPPFTPVIPPAIPGGLYGAYPQGPHIQMPMQPVFDGYPQQRPEQVVTHVATSESEGSPVIPPRYASSRSPRSSTTGSSVSEHVVIIPPPGQTGGPQMGMGEPMPMPIVINPPPTHPTQMEFPTSPGGRSTRSTDSSQTLEPTPFVIPQEAVTAHDPSRSHSPSRYPSSPRRSHSPSPSRGHTPLPQTTIVQIPGPTAPADVSTHDIPVRRRSTSPRPPAEHAPPPIIINPPMPQPTAPFQDPVIVQPGIQPLPPVPAVMQIPGSPRSIRTRSRGEDRSPSRTHSRHGSIVIQPRSRAHSRTRTPSPTRTQGPGVTVIAPPHERRPSYPDSHGVVLAPSAPHQPERGHSRSRSQSPIYYGDPGSHAPRPSSRSSHRTTHPVQIPGQPIFHDSGTRRSPSGSRRPHSRRDSSPRRRRRHRSYSESRSRSPSDHTPRDRTHRRRSPARGHRSRYDSRSPSRSRSPTRRHRSRRDSRSHSPSRSRSPSDGRSRRHRRRVHRDRPYSSGSDGSRYPRRTRHHPHEQDYADSGDRPHHRSPSGSPRLTRHGTGHDAPTRITVPSTPHPQHIPATPTIVPFYPQEDPRDRSHLHGYEGEIPQVTVSPGRPGSVYHPAPSVRHPASVFDPDVHRPDSPRSLRTQIRNAPPDAPFIPVVPSTHVREVPTHAAPRPVTDIPVDAPSHPQEITYPEDVQAPQTPYMGPIETVHPTEDTHRPPSTRPMEALSRPADIPHPSDAVPMPVRTPSPVGHIADAPPPHTPETYTASLEDYPEPSAPPTLSRIPTQRSHRPPPSEMSVMVPVPPPGQPPSAPDDFNLAEAERYREERFGEMERQLSQAAHAAEENEDRREDTFRDNEDKRERIFLENEERRVEEARRRLDEMLQGMHERLDVPLAEHAASISPETAESIKDSVLNVAQDAAGRYSSDLLTIVKEEREELARERETAAEERDRARAELDAERARLDEEKEARIQALEAELVKVREELENEKQQRITEEADIREQERQEAAERDEAVRSQLGDITNIVQDQRDMCAQKKELQDQRWAEKQGRRVNKDNQIQGIYDMVAKIMADREDEKLRADEERAAAAEKPGIERVIEELQRQNAELREALNSLSEAWRADSTRQHEETINAVRATAQEQVPFNVQGYLDEFSKALATEVRMLLGEVGKLREEKRNLQHELGYLLCMKAKYGPGGEFDPEWKPATSVPPPTEAPPPEPPMPPEEPVPAKPAWRSITPRAARRSRKAKEAPPPPQATPAPPEPRLTSWATWQPDPGLAPSPTSVEPTLLVPDMGSPGLFGPRSPRDSYRG